MIQLLIADNSSVVRSILKEIVFNSQKLKFLGEAASVDELKNAVKRLKPDMIVIDENFFGQDKSNLLVDFCDSNNITALVYYKKDTVRRPYIKNIQFEEKPEFIKFSSEKISEYAYFLEQKILEIKRDILFEKHPVSTSLNMPGEPQPLKKVSADFVGRKFKAVVIGVSTGGPTTLLELIKSLGNGYPLPLLITQHIDSFFDKNLITWLNTETSVPIHLAENNTKALPGHVYFAPSDMHLVMGPDLEDDFHMFLNHDAPVNFLRPAVDKMFDSAAQILGQDCIGVILTGMGADGAKGCKHIKEVGGYTITQDEASCVIYGMPKAAYEAGGACEVLPLNQIADRLWALVGKPRMPLC
ncbi:MAG: hypothetical protein K5681_01985 [Treponema sp.]|nr:hypothetical protein [Treponema sp.]